MKFFISIFKFLLYLIFNLKKVRFKSLEYKKIIFLDGSRFFEFQSIVNLKKNEYQIIDTRLNSDQSRFYISPKLVFYFLKFFFLYKSYSFYESYIYACIYIIKPKFIIDVNQYGFLLNHLKHFKNTEFVIINDVVKKKFKPDIEKKEDYIVTLSKFLKKNKRKKIQNLTIFLISNRDLDVYKDFGITKKSGIQLKVIGSIKADYAKEKFKNIKTKYDILLVSQLQKYNVGNELFGSAKKNSTNLIISFLNNLGRKKIAILCRSLKNSEDLEYEINHFKKKLNFKVDFLIRGKNDNFFSYKRLMQSKIIITVNSTLGWEGLIFGKKLIVAFGDFLKYYKWSPNKQDEKKMWKWNLLKLNSKKKDQYTYSSLSKLNWKNYTKKNQKYLNYLMPMNFSVKSHVFLKNYFERK